MEPIVDHSHRCRLLHRKVEPEYVEQIRELACNRPLDCKHLLLRLLLLKKVLLVALEDDERSWEEVGVLHKERELVQESREPKRSVVVDVIELLERLESQGRDSGR